MEPVAAAGRDATRGRGYSVWPTLRIRNVGRVDSLRSKAHNVTQFEAVLALLHATCSMPHESLRLVMLPQLQRQQ